MPLRLNWPATYWTSGATEIASGVPLPARTWPAVTCHSVGRNESVTNTSPLGVIARSLRKPPAPVANAASCRRDARS